LSIEQALHQHWAENQQLVSLVVPADVVTGRSHSDRPTFVSIRRQSDRPVLRTNSAEQIRQVELVFDIHSTDYQQALSIADAVIAAFDRAAPAVDTNLRVLSMCLGGQTVAQLDDRWRVALLFRLMVALTPGE